MRIDNREWTKTFSLKNQSRKEKAGDGTVGDTSIESKKERDSKTSGEELEGRNRRTLSESESSTREEESSRKLAKQPQDLKIKNSRGTKKSKSPRSAKSVDQRVVLQNMKMMIMEHCCEKEELKQTQGGEKKRQ